MELLNTGIAPLVYSYYPVDPNNRAGEGKLFQMVQGNRIWTWTYTPDGWVKDVTDPLTQTVRFSQYDLVGRLRQGILADQVSTIGFLYDRSGNTEEVEPPNGFPHTYGF